MRSGDIGTCNREKKRGFRFVAKWRKKRERERGEREERKHSLWKGKEIVYRAEE